MGRKDAFSAKWLLHILTINSPGKEKTPVTRQTLSEWKSRNLVWYEQRSIPNVHCAAALYMARAIDHGERSFLPEAMSVEQQCFYCWVKTDLTAAPLPYRADRLDELPKGSLCWTPWPGASWSDGWLLSRGISWSSLREAGALRWSHLLPPGMLEHNIMPFRYDMTLHDLHRWDEQVAQCIDPQAISWRPELVAPSFEHSSSAVFSNTDEQQAKFLQEDPELIQDAARMILWRLAPSLFLRQK